ncbi:MAG: DUF2334 domain-containing protein [Elusimicrobia bacterium]|nr:DUF2334 domain-containing protein [Elusimicrobiota bacterium]
MREKTYTLKYLLQGLYKNDREIEDFLKVSRFSLDFISPVSPWYLLYNLKKYKTFQYYHHLQYVSSVRDTFCKFKGIQEKKGRPLFLIRVDDFPHWEKTLDDFKKFHNIMEEYEAPYLLGVTPSLSLNRHNPLNKNFRLLNDNDVKLIKHPLIEIALHGFSHQTNNSKKNMEFAGLSKEQAKEKIEKGLAIFKEFDIKSSAFIPPFDRIDRASYKVLTEYFKIITGGPESARYLGHKVSPSFFKGALYIPAYRPLSSYQNCKGLVNAIKEHNMLYIRRTTILPLVIHWANETKDNYASLKELLEIIKGNVMQWKDLLFF